MPRRAKSKSRSKKRVSIISAPRSQNVSGSGKYNKPRRYRGRGDYKEDKLEAGPIERVGRYLGQGAGRLLGKWLGTGDYVNAHGNVVLAPDAPKMFNDGHAVTISHREYLGDIISSSSANTFLLQAHAINPADSNTFPWLSRVVKQSFQQYKFEQLCFEFRTFSADALNSTNTALGNVSAAVNYDYGDEDFASRAEIENSDWAKSCKPSESMIIPVECDPKMTGMNGLLYIVNGNNIPSGSDPKTYYLGKFQIATSGCQGTSVNLGSLYVHYKVKLYKPVMTPPLSDALIMTRVRSTVSTTNHFGTATTASDYNCDSIGVSMSASVLTIDKTRLQVGQRFLFFWSCNGASTASLAYPSISISSGGTGLTYFESYGSTTAVAPRSAVVTDTQVLVMAIFTVVSANANITITLADGTLPTSASAMVQLHQICGTPLENIGTFTP